jgi:hypothetical protein
MAFMASHTLSDAQLSLLPTGTQPGAPVAPPIELGTHKAPGIGVIYIGEWLKEKMNL